MRRKDYFLILTFILAFLIFGCNNITGVREEEEHETESDNTENIEGEKVIEPPESYILVRPDGSSYIHNFSEEHALYIGKTYESPADGFVIGYGIDIEGKRGNIRGYAGSSMYQHKRIWLEFSMGVRSFAMPVAKGQYWRIEQEGCEKISFEWIPISKIGLKGYFGNWKFEYVREPPVNWGDPFKPINFQALSDGFVVGYVVAFGEFDSCIVKGYSDSANPPKDQKIDIAISYPESESIIMPVQKGNYWRIEWDDCYDAEFYWVPLLEDREN